MSNLLKHAKTELGILIKDFESKNEEPIVKEFIPEILNLVKAFAKSGQSGGSAPYTAKCIVNTIEKLLLYKPLIGITGEESEWVKVDSDSFQNKRLSSIFKQTTEKPYYLDAIVFRELNGNCFTSNCIKFRDIILQSRQEIKSFPFTPKTFYIDVKLNPNTEYYEVINDKQIDEVFEYYKFKECKNEQ